MNEQETDRTTELAELRDEVRMLRDKLAETETRCSELEKDSRSVTVDWGDTPDDSFIENFNERVNGYSGGGYQPVAPFSVNYDPAAEKWYIYIPDGCVYADGHKAVFNGSDEDVPPDPVYRDHDHPEFDGDIFLIDLKYMFSPKLFCVIRSTGSGATFKLRSGMGGEESDHSICVLEFDNYFNSVVRQHVNSVLTIGGDGSGSGRVIVDGPAPSVKSGADIMITAVRYDPYSHQLQAKCRGLNFSFIKDMKFLYKITEESEDFECILNGQCSPHSAEHPAGGDV